MTEDRRMLVEMKTHHKEITRQYNSLMAQLTELRDYCDKVNAQYSLENTSQKAVFPHEALGFAMRIKNNLEGFSGLIFCTEQLD